MKRVAIVGFGFCGRLAFYHLSKQKNLSISIFEKNNIDSFGSAFSEFSKNYILNVPAIKMSAFSDKPSDFYEFISKNYPSLAISETDFAPRYIYGEYLKSITKEAFLNAKNNNLEVNFIPSEVTSIHKKSDYFNIADSQNKLHKVSHIALATSFKQSNLECDFSSEGLIKNLWCADAKKFHEEKINNKNICIIGSGLTAVDVIIGLKKKDFQGKIVVISRRGNFPKKHFSSIQKIPNFISAADAKNGMLFLCLKIRKFLRENSEFDLRHIIDSIRPITKEIWRNLDHKNKKLFWRFMPYWNIFRHRAPASSIEIIDEMIKNGQVEIRKSGVQKIISANNKIILQAKSGNIEADYLVNCLGFEFRSKKYPLMQQMINEELLEEDFVLVKSNHKNIHLLGGLNIARDFEITSVPDMKFSVENAIDEIC